MFGCSNHEKKNSGTEPIVKQELYPVSIDGNEIRVGETNVQAILDMGMKVTVSEMTSDNQINQYEIDPNTELEAMSYYTGASIWVTDSIFAHISMATDEKTVKMGEATIARLEFSLTSGTPEELQRIAFDGVPVMALTREKAGEMFSDFQGDEVMWFQYGDEYKYMLTFDNEGNLNSFSLEKEYDVDWLGNGN